jgi:hypothetical protein
VEALRPGLRATFRLGGCRAGGDHTRSLTLLDGDGRIALVAVQD